MKQRLIRQQTIQKSDSSKTDAPKAGSSEVETQKDSNASDALSVKSKIATEKTGKVSIEYPILSNLRDASMTQASMSF